jgi:hypothetical protein
MQSPKIHNFGGVRNGLTVGGEGDFNMMQQPTANGEGVARRGYAYEGVGMSFLGLKTL